MEEKKLNRIPPVMANEGGIAQRVKQCINLAVLFVEALLTKEHIKASWKRVPLKVRVLLGM